MYNKLFTKILDSSIWLEKNTTRIVWLTLIAAMDEDGFCQFASSANLAHRAIVDPKECDEAILCLESPDSNSSDRDHEGRRIERVPGGWMILNSHKYKDLVTREIAKERTRDRVRRHRENKKTVTNCNGELRTSNGLVTQSDTDTKTNINTETKEYISSSFKVFNDIWCERYKQTLGVSYKFSGAKDAISSKALVSLDGYTPKSLVDLAEKAWRNKNGFWSKQAATIAGFSSKFNEIRQEVGGLSKSKTINQAF